MLVADVYNKESLRKAATRDGYGAGLVILGKKNKNVVVLCADLTESTRSEAFAKAFPDRFFELGVAEQNMAAVAAGLAVSGKIPFISSYAMFSPGRNWEQVRTTICYNNVNVKVAGAHAGVSVGPDGATHQAIEDIAIMRVIPNMTIIVPADAEEARRATVASLEVTGPTYLRFTRADTPVFTTSDAPFKIGRAEVLTQGSDVAIIACGPLVYEALLAAQQLEKEGIHARVINSHTIKPLDAATVVAAAKETGAVVMVEEHQVMGGLGGAVAEVLSQQQPTPIEFVGIQNHFGESGNPQELWQAYGLDSVAIILASKKVIKRKS